MLISLRIKAPEAALAAGEHRAGSAALLCLERCGPSLAVLYQQSPAGDPALPATVSFSRLNYFTQQPSSFGKSSRRERRRSPSRTLAGSVVRGGLVLLGPHVPPPPFQPTLVAAARSQPLTPEVALLFPTTRCCCPHPCPVSPPRSRLQEPPSGRKSPHAAPVHGGGDAP